MTWASASGGGGEKIGEVRMFVGEIPAGWEGIGVPVLSGRFSDLKFLLSSAPRVSSSVTPQPAAGHKCVAFVSPGKVCAFGDFAAGTTISPLSRTGSVLDVGLQTVTSLPSRILAKPAISVAAPGGGVFVAGGIVSTGAGDAPTAACNLMDSSGVITTLASMPQIGGRGASGWLNAGEVACFGLYNGQYANTPTLKAFKYSFSTNTHSYLPDVPESFGNGLVFTVGGVTNIITNGNTSKRFVFDEYKAPYYTEVPLGLPGGLTGITGVLTSCMLSDGRVLFATNSAIAGGSTSVGVRLFIVGDDQVIIDGPRPPGGLGVTNIWLADNGFAPGEFVFAASSPSNSELGGVLEDSGEGFLSKASIVYARKLQ